MRPCALCMQGHADCDRGGAAAAPTSPAWRPTLTHTCHWCASVISLCWPLTTYTISCRASLAYCPSLFCWWLAHCPDHLQTMSMQPVAIQATNQPTNSSTNHQPTQLTAGVALSELPPADAARVALAFAFFNVVNPGESSWL